MAINSVCPKCVLIKKSGMSSCCGRGGSWFGNCGGAGDTKFDHTWDQGLQACQVHTRAKIVIDKQLRNPQYQSNVSDDAVAHSSFHPVVTVAKRLAFTSVPALGAQPIATPGKSSIAHATATMDSKMVTEKISAKMSTSSSNIKSTNALITTSAQIQMGYISTDVSTTSPEYARFPSQACEQLFDITIQIGLSFFVCCVGLN